MCYFNYVGCFRADREHTFTSFLDFLFSCPQIHCLGGKEKIIKKKNQWIQCKNLHLWAEWSRSASLRVPQCHLDRLHDQAGCHSFLSCQPHSLNLAMELLHPEKKKHAGPLVQLAPGGLDFCRHGNNSKHAVTAVEQSRLKEKMVLTWEKNSCSKSCVLLTSSSTPTSSYCITQHHHHTGYSFLFLY